MPLTAFVTVYARPEATYIATSDQTTAGVWIGSGEVEKVATDDLGALGNAVSQRLAASRVQVAHPQPSEWTVQRRQSLEPLVQLAGVRSRRAFVTGAVAVGVSRDGTAVLVKPYRQDVRRPDIFDEISDEAQVLSDPTDDAIAVAVRAAIQIARDSQV